MAEIIKEIGRGKGQVRKVDIASKSFQNPFSGNHGKQDKPGRETPEIMSFAVECIHSHFPRLLPGSARPEVVDRERHGHSGGSGLVNTRKEGGRRTPGGRAEVQEEGDAVEATKIDDDGRQIRRQQYASISLFQSGTTG